MQFSITKREKDEIVEKKQGKPQKKIKIVLYVIVNCKKITLFACHYSYQQKKMETMEIGGVIRNRRQSLRSTQNALAELSNVSVRMIKAIEGGYANPSVKTLNKILNALGLQLTIIDKEETAQ